MCWIGAALCQDQPNGLAQISVSPIPLQECESGEPISQIAAVNTASEGSLVAVRTYASTRIIKAPDLASDVSALEHSQAQPLLNITHAQTGNRSHLDFAFNTIGRRRPEGLILNTQGALYSLKPDGSSICRLTSQHAEPYFTKGASRGIIFGKAAFGARRPELATVAFAEDVLLLDERVRRFVERLFQRLLLTKED